MTTTRGIPAIPVGLAFAIASIVAGCQAVPDGLLPEDLGAVAGGFLADATTVSREEVEAVPFASIGVRADDSSQALVALGTVERDRLVWITGERIAIATVNGRIVQTVGLPQDLRDLSLGGIDPVARAAESGAPVAWAGSAVLPRFGEAPVALSCTTTPRGLEPVSILGVVYDTVKIEERCEAPALRWRFRNSFWVGADGVVIKSRQATAPLGPIFEIETLRPYARS